MKMEGRELERLLANHCAPVLCRHKTANLIAARQELVQELPEILKGSRISWFRLCGCKKFCHLLFYDTERLEWYLALEPHREFLQKYGYKQDLSSMLALLAQRYEEFQKKGKPFPHEIGLFLEYPLEDIEGFIRFGGKNALESGYWKVYGNAEKARETFHFYDRLRRMMKSFLESGMTLCESAEKLNKTAWNGM